MGVQGLLPSGFVVSYECRNSPASPFDKLTLAPSKGIITRDRRLPEPAAYSLH